MKTTGSLSVKHSCGCRAAYLMLVDPELVSEIAVEIGSKPCLLCAKRAKGYGKWGWLKRKREQAAREIESQT